MAIALIGLTSGCIFSPKKEDKKVVDTGGYREPTTPLNVLYNLQKAYQAKDSVTIKTIYDPSYAGTSQDVNAPDGSQIANFTYDDEVAHVAALARSTTISSVKFELPPEASWLLLESDDPSHPEWAEVQVNSWHVEVYDAQTLYTVESFNPLTFYFKPIMDGTGRLTYKIVKWVEIGASSTGTT